MLPNLKLLSKRSFLSRKKNSIYGFILGASSNFRSPQFNNFLYLLLIDMVQLLLCGNGHTEHGIGWLSKPFLYADCQFLIIWIIYQIFINLNKKLPHPLMKISKKFILINLLPQLFQYLLFFLSISWYKINTLSIIAGDYCLLSIRLKSTDRKSY